MLRGVAVPAGKDSLAAFKQAFETAGGKVIDEIPMGGPGQVPDFTPFFQRVKDKKPDVFFVFVPAGDHAVGVVKTYSALGMRQAGIRLIGPGDITQDIKLREMGDEALGLITMHHYNADLDNPANKRLVAAWKKEYGARLDAGLRRRPGYDGMAAIAHVARTLNCKIDPDKAMFEIWRSREAFDANGMSAHQREFRDKLAGMTGALYDERLYEILN